MVNIDQPVVADTSHMLRDILQTKDIRFQDLEKQQVNQIMENEKVVPGNDVTDDHPGRSDQESVGGSDEESSFMEQGRVDEAEVDDLKSDGEENCSNDVHSTSESKEAKRARVDNIISSMQHPAQFMDADSIYSNEVRRQKRKQNIPQQHESLPKIRRLDANPCEEDLWNLRNQLFAVQNYFKQQQEENLHKQMTGFPAMENIQRLHQAYFANLSARHAERIPSPPPTKPPVFTFKDSKITGDHFNIAEHVRESVNANKVGDLDEKELDELIVNLKSKIEEAVSVTVDKELAKFFQKRKPKEMEHHQLERQLKEEKLSNHELRKPEPEKKPTNHSLDHILQLPEKSPNSHNGFRVPERQSAFELPKLGGGLSELPRPPFPHHPPLAYPPLSFYLPSNLHPPSLYSCPIVPPEQTEALSLVVNTPKKKRTKVTDTRLSPRAARALLNDNGTLSSMFDHERPLSAAGLGHMGHCLPTSVAIPNPSLQHSDLMSFYREQALCGSPTDNGRNTPCSSNSPSDGGYGSYLKNEFFNDSDSFDSQGKQTIDTLTPMHLRKAKLMFFYVRYPSSAILKVYFPDVQFNKNNTAQLVKWFSNFREFYYIQMEKYARQAIAEGCKHAEELVVTTDSELEFYYIQMEKYARQAIAEGCKHAEELVVTTDSELYRVLNLHYNRNNQIDVPENFRLTVQATLREFFNAIMATKDSEPSWKKPIYKVIARLDDAIPEYFKSPNWMDQLGEA